MKPEIENLKAWIYGESTTGYQRALGMREFEQLLSYVNELEQLRQPPVSGALPSIDPLDDEDSEIHKICREIAEMSDEEFKANCKAISDMLSKSKSKSKGNDR